MKIKLICILFLSLGIIYSANAQKDKKVKAGKQSAQVSTEQGPKLANRIDSVSYSIGIVLGGNMIKSGLADINPNILATAIVELQNKQKPLFDDAKCNEIINSYITEQRSAKGDKNLKEGNAFLEKNKLEQGVVTLPSGLQYKILKEGTGAKPILTDKVTVTYHGTLISGKVFDSSVERGDSIHFVLSNVIEGWKEGLQLMNVGSKWKLFVPSKLGYGENQQQGSPIEPNSVLIFEVELIAIEKAEAGQFQPQINLQDEKINK